MCDTFSTPLFKDEQSDMRFHLNRAKEIHRLRWRLQRDSFPRLQMLLIVLFTGGSGFVASFVLLITGMSAMWLRYLCAFGIAYLVFLFMLWLWLRTRADDYADIPDLSDLASSGGSKGECASAYSGEGGHFGGGGASSSFDAGGTYDAGVEMPSVDDGGAVTDALGAAGEAEELAVPLVVLVLLGAMLLSSLWVVYSAPVLFAELLVDGVLAARLYRRLRGVEPQHWLETAVRRTVWPFVLTALMLVAAGWAMQLYAPEAHTLGEVIAHAKHSG